jgi:hypothetical protein
MRQQGFTKIYTSNKDSYNSKGNAHIYLQGVIKKPYAFKEKGMENLYLLERSNLISRPVVKSDTVG